MAQFIFIRSAVANAAGGGDFTPDAVNWGNISVTGTSGYEDNEASAQTLASIDEIITLRAAWTSTSSAPAWGQWIKNGVAVQAPAPTPVEVSAGVGDTLYFAVYAAHTGTTGNYDTGTVTVTNQSDSAASLDTFTFAVQYVYSGGGTTDPGDKTVGGDPHAN